MSFNGNLQPSSDVGEDLTNKGDLHTFSTENTALPVGADTRILQANSATSTGLEWIVAGGGGIEESFTVTTKTTTTPSSQTGFKGVIIDCTDLTAGNIQMNVDGSAHGDPLTVGDKVAYAINPSSSLNFVSDGAGKDFSTASYVQTSTATTSYGDVYGLWVSANGEYWCHCMGNGTACGGAQASALWDITTLPANLGAKAGNPYNANEAYGVTFGLDGVGGGEPMNYNGRNGTFGTGIYTTSIGTKWNAGTAGVMTSNELNIDGTDNTPRGLDMDASGGEWYTVGQQHNKMYHWQTQAGAPAWQYGYALYIDNVTVGVLKNELDHSAQFTGDGLDCSVTSDGKFCAILSQAGNIYGYELATAWDLSTSSFTASFSTTAQSSDIRGVQIHPSGNSVYVLDGQNATNNPIFEYDTSGAVTGNIKIVIIGT